MILSQAIQGFIIHKTAEGKSPSTLSEYKRHLTILGKYLNDPQVDQITTANLRAFLAYLRTEYTPRRKNGSTEPLSQKTLHNFWITLRSFYTWAVQELSIQDAFSPIQASDYELPELNHSPRTK